MAKSAMTHARLTPEVKKAAEAILKEMGLSISSAYELFYRQIIAHHGLPFEARVPKQQTIEAMREAREGIGKQYDSVHAMLKDLDS